MQLTELKDKLVAVLGFGQEGRSTAHYLIKHGVKPVLFDQRPWEEWSKEDQEFIKSLNVNFIFGPQAFLELAGFDVAFRSPGIPISSLQVKDSRLQLTSQTKYFFDNCPAPIIGVTGTKGKGTTCALVNNILTRRVLGLYENPKNVHLTGNIGGILPLDRLESVHKNELVIYELSSFQLQDLETSPHIAVVLMVTEEHLNYHKNVGEYVGAKASITKFQSSEDFAVINADFVSSVEIGQMGAGKKIFFSRKKELGEGIYFKDGKMVVKNVLGQNFELPAENFQLRGIHNLENIAAATAACILAGAGREEIEISLNLFKGLEHRLEYAGEKNGAKYYNDSFSTTPESAIAAIEAFVEPLIVILGGSAKNSDFSELGKIIASKKNIKAIILVGIEAGRIKKAIGKTNTPFLEGATSMGEISKQIDSISKPRDVVLLSPACASFGMFENYKERGEAFKAIINPGSKLKALGPDDIEKNFPRAARQIF